MPLIAVLIADATVVGHAAGGRGTKVAVANRPRPGASVDVVKQRAAYIRGLLRRRGYAVVHHNRAMWLSTVDPQQPQLRAQQARVFANLAHVDFTSWSYTFDPGADQVPSVQSERYGAPTWAPSEFSLRYRLRGFDVAPTNLAQYPTFVLRHGAWYLASLDDFVERGQVSSLDIWDFGPVQVLRTPHVLVMGHPGAARLMRQVAAEVAADIPRVDAVWNRPWSQRAVVLVPATEHELGVVVGDAGDLSHIAAVASAEVQDVPGRPKPVGDRIGINPSNWPKLSPLGQRIVLTHELTHVATRASTSESTPSWVVEGFADYVGYLDSGVPATVAAQELAVDVRAGRSPRRLPSDAQFNDESTRLAQAYEGAWIACRLIAKRWGQGTLDRFYVAVGTSSAGGDAAVVAAVRSVLHTTMHGFLGAWHGYLRTELS